MQAYIKDNEIYFKDVYERNINTVYKLCFIYFRGNKANIEDAIQTVFFNMLKKEITFQSVNHEKAWFITVTTNTCKNILKSKWNKNISIDELELDIPASTEENKEILEEVLKLPNKYKQVIYMHYYEGYSGIEISKILGIKENTIYSYLNKARTLLKEKLKEDFYE